MLVVFLISATQLPTRAVMNKEVCVSLVVMIHTITYKSKQQLLNEAAGHLP